MACKFPQNRASASFANSDPVAAAGTAAKDSGISTGVLPSSVIPAQAETSSAPDFWIPACAGTRRLPEDDANLNKIDAVWDREDFMDIGFFSYNTEYGIRVDDLQEPAVSNHWSAKTRSCESTQRRRRPAKPYII